MMTNWRGCETRWEKWSDRRHGWHWTYSVMYSGLKSWWDEDRKDWAEEEICKNESPARYRLVNAETGKAI